MSCQDQFPVDSVFIMLSIADMNTNTIILMDGIFIQRIMNIIILIASNTNLLVIDINIILVVKRLTTTITTGDRITASANKIGCFTGSNELRFELTANHTFRQTRVVNMNVMAANRNLRTYHTNMMRMTKIIIHQISAKVKYNVTLSKEFIFILVISIMECVRQIVILSKHITLMDKLAQPFQSFNRQIIITIGIALNIGNDVRMNNIQLTPLLVVPV